VKRSVRIIKIWLPKIPLLKKKTLKLVDVCFPSDIMVLRIIIALNKVVKTCGVRLQLMIREYTMVSGIIVLILVLTKHKNI